MVTNSFAENLKKIFLYYPDKKKLLCKELNVSPTTVLAWTLGKRMPHIDTLVNIAEFFNISVKQLLSSDYHPKKPQVLKSLRYYKKLVDELAPLYGY